MCYRPKKTTSYQQVNSKPDSRFKCGYQIVETILGLIYLGLMAFFAGIASDTVTSDSCVVIAGEQKVVPIFKTVLNQFPFPQILFPTVEFVMNLQVFFFGIPVFLIGSLASFLNAWVKILEAYRYETTFVSRAIQLGLVYPLVAIQSGNLDKDALIMIGVLAFMKVIVFCAAGRNWPALVISLIAGIAAWYVIIDKYITTNSEFSLNDYGNSVLWLCFAFWIVFVFLNVLESAKVFAKFNTEELLMFYEATFFIVAVVVSLVAYFELCQHPTPVAKAVCGPSF